MNLVQCPCCNLACFSHYIWQQEQVKYSVYYEFYAHKIWELYCKMDGKQDICKVRQMYKLNLCWKFEKITLACTPLEALKNVYLQSDRYICSYYNLTRRFCFNWEYVLTFIHTCSQYHDISCPLGIVKFPNKQDGTSLSELISFNLICIVKKREPLLKKMTFCPKRYILLAASVKLLWKSLFRAGPFYSWHW